MVIALPFMSITGSPFTSIFSVVSRAMYTSLPMCTEIFVSLSLGADTFFGGASSISENFPASALVTDVDGRVSRERLHRVPGRLRQVHVELGDADVDVHQLVAVGDGRVDAAPRVAELDALRRDGDLLAVLDGDVRLGPT